MSNRTLADEIITLINNTANNNPAPILCSITANYLKEPDRVDIKTADGILKYVKLIGNNKIGLEGVLCFLNGNLNDKIVITSFDNGIKDYNEINEKISELKDEIKNIKTSGDLSEYAKFNDIYVKNQEDFVEKLDLTISNLIGRV